MDADHVEAVQQILTEPAGRTFGADVAIGGADEADVDLAAEGFADATELLLEELPPSQRPPDFRPHWPEVAKVPCLTEQATLTICSAPAAKRVPAIAQNC